MNRIATVLGVVLAAVAFAPRVSAQERIATNDTYNEFPRWKALVNPFNVKDGGGNRLLPNNISIGQDYKNVLHVVGGFQTSSGGCQIHYVNSDWIDRRSNGFSEPFQVTTAGASTQCKPSDVAVLSDGSLTVFWKEPQSGGTEDIKYRTRSATGSWGSVSTGITGIAGDVFTKLRTTSVGTAIHMVYLHTNGPSTKLQYVNPTTSWTPSTVSDSATSLASAGGANIAVDGSGNKYVVYEDYPNGGGEYARYRSNTGGGWSASTDIAQDGYSPDVFVDTGSNVHIAYVKGAGANTGKVYHRPAIGGSDTHVGNTTAATAAFDRVRLVTDSRNRPNVLWSTNADVGYAVKVGSSWTRQETIQEPGRGNLGNGRGTNDWSFGGIDPVIDSFDNVSWIDRTSGLVSGMYEPNLSCEDGCSTCGIGCPNASSIAGSCGSKPQGGDHFSFGPGATGHATTGNLDFSLKLFGTKGVGFCTFMVLKHNSLNPEWGVMSNGWSHNYHIYVIDGATGYNNNQDNITFVSGDGRRVIFRYNATSSVHLADSEYGVFSKIARVTESSGTEWVHSKYKLTTKGGLVVNFRGNGKLDSMEDTNSNTIEFHYAGDVGYSADSTHPTGALVEIEDSLKNLVASQAGRKSKFTYNSDRQIATVQDPKASSANYSVSYDSSSKRLSGVSFTGVSGVQWTFTYHTSNHTSNGYRLGMLDLIRTPRGTAEGTPYGTSYRWYQDNRLWKATDPSVSVVTNESADASPTSDTPVRLFEYTDPTSTFSTPNQSAPGSNTVPITVFSDRRGYDTTVECQYRRALVDNITDPMSDSAIYTHDGTYRNLTEAKDKRGFTTKYTYHTSATPTWIKDNLWKIERPNSDGSGYIDPVVITYTTDGLNRIASREDARGNETTYEYDAYGNRETTTYPTVTLVISSSQTASESWTYTTRGRVETHTLPEGGVTTYHYDDDDDTGLVTKIQEDGQDEADARAFEYDDMGNLIEFTASPNNQVGGVTGYTLDGLHRVTTVTDPLTETTVYVYDANSNVTSVTNRRGKETTHAYNVRNERTSTTKPYGSSQTATAYFDYDRNGNLRKTTNFRGYTSWRIYDADGRVIETHQQGAGLVGGGGSTDHEKNFEYDENGNLTELTSVSSTSRVTTYAYDARNNRTQVNFPVGSLKEEFVYDANDNLLATNGKDGSTFKYGSASVYDERNRVIKQVRLDTAYSSGSPSGPLTSILHDKNGKVKQVWNANATSFGSAQSRQFTYDDRNRLTQRKDGMGTAVRQFTYYGDNSLHIVEGQDPAPSAGGLMTVATYEYSKRSELTEIKDALNYDWTFEYDENGNRTKSTNPGSVETVYTYDDADRLSKTEIDPAGLDVERAYAYDAQGNQTSTTVYNPATSSNNAVYAFAYDKADRLEKLTNPNSSNYQLWTYNDHGEVATHRDANAKVVTLTYDGLGRLTSEAHGSPFSVTIARTYYAGTGLATEEDDGTREIVNTFNVLLELTATDWSVSSSAFKSLDFTYDDAGNRDEMVDPEGAISGYSYTYKYTYDDDNRLWKVKRGGTDEAVYLYDASGHVKDVTLGNGSKTTYEYTDRYQTSKVKTATSGGTTRAEYTYTYDSRMRCTQQVRNHLGETIDYTYDAANRLTDEDSSGSSGSPPISVPARNLTWTYDDAGNRTSSNDGSSTTNYTYNSESRLTQETLANGDVYDYTNDANGNRTDRDFTPNGAGSPTIQETYSYNHLNRLSSYVKTVSGSGTVSNFAYAHAPTGQRISKNDLTANTTEWYMSDGKSMVTDYSQVGSGSLTLAVSYVNSIRSPAQIARITASGGAVHYYLSDAETSVTHILDSSQVLVNSRVMDSWGQTVSSSLAVADRHGYHQGALDSESGLLELPPELYDPSIGRSCILQQTQDSEEVDSLCCCPLDISATFTGPIDAGQDGFCYDIAVTFVTFWLPCRKANSGGCSTVWYEFDPEKGWMGRTFDKNQKGMKGMGDGKKKSEDPNDSGRDIHIGKYRSCIKKGGSGTVLGAIGLFKAPKCDCNEALWYYYSLTYTTDKDGGKVTGGKGGQIKELPERTPNPPGWKPWHGTDSE